MSSIVLPQTVSGSEQHRMRVVCIMFFSARGALVVLLSLVMLLALVVLPGRIDISGGARLSAVTLQDRTLGLLG